MVIAASRHILILKIQKPEKVFFLDIDVSISIKIFQCNLVTQSLQIKLSANTLLKNIHLFIYLLFKNRN